MIRLKAALVYVPVLAAGMALGSATTLLAGTANAAPDTTATLSAVQDAETKLVGAKVALTNATQLLQDAMDALNASTAVPAAAPSNATPPTSTPLAPAPSAGSDGPVTWGYYGDSE